VPDGGGRAEREPDALDELLDARLEDWEARLALGMLCIEAPAAVIKVVRFLTGHREAPAQWLTEFREQEERDA
jgi:hypothetical protein